MLLKYATVALALWMASAVLGSSPARAADKLELLRDANEVVNDLRRDPAFTQAARMISQARAVYIVPRLIKGGFIFGAEGGSGVLLVRHGHVWSEPRFYDMGSGSFGLQAGLQQAKLVFIINSRRALDGIQHGGFKIGANAGITVANLSSGAEGAVTPTGGDIVVWTSGTGAYGGLTFNGTVISPNEDLNATPSTGPEAELLRRNLASFW